MKKVISYLLVFATLIPCCKNTYADKKGLNTNLVSTSAKDADIMDLDKVIFMLKKDQRFLKIVKEIVLEVSKDESVTDKSSKNHSKDHKENLWLKIAKIPLDSLWYIVKNACNYLLGKTTSELLAKLFPWILLVLDAKFNFPVSKTLLNKTVSAIKYFLLPNEVYEH